MKTVRIYPTGTHHIPGIPAIEQDVSRERAEELLAYHPPAFTTDPPPDVPAAEPIEAPDDPGPSDSPAEE